MSTPKPKRRVPFWLIVLLGIVLSFLCVGAITIKNTLDEKERVQAQARELQSKIDEAEGEAGIWPKGQPEGPGDFGPPPKPTPLGPGDFDPVPKPNHRGRGLCNCKPGDPLCSCL